MRFLSEIINKPVIDSEGSKIGKFKDFVASVSVTYPIVEAITIRTTDKKDLNIPWEDVKSINKEIKLKIKLMILKSINLRIRIFNSHMKY
jgi:magnesium transporter